MPPSTSSTSRIPTRRAHFASPHFRHILALQGTLCCTHDAHYVRTPALHYRDRDFLSNCLEEKFRYSHLPEKQLHHTSRRSRLCPQGAWRYCNRARSTRGCEEMEIQLRIDYFSCQVLNFIIDSFDYYYIGMPQQECKDRMRRMWLMRLC